LALGFEQCKNDPCLFCRANHLEDAIFCVYVEDFFAVKDELALKDTINGLSEEFMLQVNRNADEYLGCRIEKTKMVLLSYPNQAF